MIPKTESKADRTAKVYKFICPIIRLNKTSLDQGLEKLTENRINGYNIQNNTKIKKIKCDWWRKTIVKNLCTEAT